MPLWLFIFFGTLAVVSALGVVLQRNPVHCLLSLVLTLLVIAALFVGLDATTVGLLQAIVYAGAIMILFLFVIWLLNLQAQPIDTGRLALKFFGSLGAAALMALIAGFFLDMPAGIAMPARVSAQFGSVNLLADSLFSDYLVAFEITSLLLLVAVIGSVALARRMGAERVAGQTPAATASSDYNQTGPEIRKAVNQ